MFTQRKCKEKKGLIVVVLSVMESQMFEYLHSHSWYFMTSVDLLVLVFETLANSHGMYIETFGRYHTHTFNRILATFILEGDVVFSQTMAVFSTVDGTLIDVFAVHPVFEQYITLNGLRASRMY